MVYGKVEYDVPSTLHTMSYFLMDIFVYTVLAFYFDHVDSSNRGKSYSAYFFCQKKYWVKETKSERRARNSTNDVIRRDIDEISKLLSDKEEKLLVRSSNISCIIKYLQFSKYRFR